MADRDKYNKRHSNPLTQREPKQLPFLFGECMTYKRKLMDAATWQTCRVSMDHPPICDFCGSDQPVFVYAASRMDSGVFVNCWRWCACQYCAHAIENREMDWLESVLVIKIRKTMALSIPSTYILQAVRKALEEFYTYAIKE